MQNLSYLAIELCVSTLQHHEHYWLPLWFLLTNITNNLYLITCETFLQVLWFFDCATATVTPHIRLHIWGRVWPIEMKNRFARCSELSDSQKLFGIHPARPLRQSHLLFPITKSDLSCTIYTRGMGDWYHVDFERMKRNAVIPKSTSIVVLIVQ